MLCLSIDLGATEKPKIGPLFKPALEGHVDAYTDPGLFASDMTSGT